METFKKRQKEAARREKQRQKAARRVERKNEKVLDKSKNQVEDPGFAESVSQSDRG